VTVCGEVCQIVVESAGFPVIFEVMLLTMYLLEHHRKTTGPTDGTTVGLSTIDFPVVFFPFHLPGGVPPDLPVEVRKPAENPPNTGGIPVVGRILPSLRPPKRV
jgi:hypothetical protein